MSKLILKGALAEKYGAEHIVKTNNLSEAIRIVDANKPGFKSSFIIDGNYAVFKNDKNIDASQLTTIGTYNTVWTIEPIPYGSKRGGILQTVLGVVLIIIGIVCFKFGGAAVSKIGMDLMVAGAISTLGGVATYLSSSNLTNVDTSGIEEDKSSYLFNGPTNKTQAGHARAICYGEVWSSTINIGYNFRHIDLMVNDESEFAITETYGWPWNR